MRGIRTDDSGLWSGRTRGWQSPRYAAGYTDGTGLIKFGARYYNPTLTRFTQPDPSGQEQNNYTYAGDNPITNTDPTGLINWGEIGGGIVAIGSAIVAVASAPVTVPLAIGAGIVFAGGALLVADGSSGDGDVIPGDPQVGCYPENDCY